MALFSSPLGGAGILLLCLWLNGCLAVWRTPLDRSALDCIEINNVWSRIYQRGRMLPLYTEVYLEYEGTLFVEWDVPLLCTVSNKSSPMTTLRCPVPGTYKIRPVVTKLAYEDKERYLSIIADINCFLWYMYLYQEAEDSFDQKGLSNHQDIIAWIIDPENVDSSELANSSTKLHYTATSPSPYSQVLSKQFWNLGQRPVIRTSFQRREYPATAFPEQGIWKIKVPSATEDITAHIYGKAITFQDCFAVDTPVVIAHSPINLKNDYNLSISSPNGSNIMVSWSECFPTSAVLVTDFGTFYTNDGFITSKEIKFPTNIIDTALIHSIKEVAVFYDYTLILIGGIIYQVEEHAIFRLGEEEGLPESGIIGLKSRTWCPSEYPELTFLSDIIIWTNDSVYLQSRHRWYIFLTNTTMLKETLVFRPTADISILKACFDSVPIEIALLIECSGCVSTKVLYLAVVNELTDRWLLRGFSLSASVHGIMNMEVLFSASTSMLLWDDDKVYYTYEGNKINGYLKVSGTDDIFSAASEGSTIHQIIIDRHANTIIKLKNNVLYFLKFEMTHAVKLAIWENEYKSFAFYWIIAGVMYLLTVDGHNIKRQAYPLKTEVSSAVFRLHEVCPYISFKHNVQSNVYFVDKNQNMTVWTQIVFVENLGLFAQILIYKPHLLKQKTDISYEIARGICTKIQTTTFYHEHDYSVYSNEFLYYHAMSTSTGVMTIEIKPSSSGKTCASSRVVFPPSSFTYMLAAMSLDTWRLKSKPSSCPDHNFTFVVPQKYTWFKTSEDLTIQYDKNRYGCPIDVYYGEPFRPVVKLYDGNTFIDIVKSEYALWEMNGRTDFYYNATMNEAKCIRYAQNWDTMTNRDDSQDLTVEEIDDIWGPHNYKSCFKFEHGHFKNMHDPYEILNQSGINSITWPKYHTGTYLFRLRILDPNFSFCDYSVFFAVRTYGIIESPSALKIAGFSVLIVTLFLGVLVFSYFRYVTIFRTIRFVDPLLPLHPQQSVTTSADELKKEA